MTTKVCERCGKFWDKEIFTYTSDGQGPMCPECASIIEAEFEAEEAEKLYRK